MKDFLAWYAAEARPPLSRAIVQQYRSVLESAGRVSASVNLQLSAIRKLATEAAENDLLDQTYRYLQMAFSCPYGQNIHAALL